MTAAGTAQEPTASPGGGSFDTIEVSKTGRVGLIRIARPEVLNALDDTVMREVVAAACAFDADRGIGAIVVTGSERAFAAGADIEQMAHLTFAEAHLDDLFSGWRAFADIRTPTIAAVAGWALGGGCELAMMCDIVIAANNARFGQPEIKLGVIPGLGGTQRLVRAIGKAKAMDLLLTGRSLTAEEAERAGLVSRVVPLADLLGEAVRCAETISSASLPVAYALTKAVDVAFESTLQEGLRFERQSFLSLFALADQKEGMAAFLAKRPPEFTGA